MKITGFVLMAALTAALLTACGGSSNSSTAILATTPSWPSSTQLVAAAYIQSVAFRNTTTAVAWGSNGYGQLGNASSANSLTPTRVVGLSQQTGIVTGGTHSLAFVNGSTVRAWGNNGHGQLGNGTTTATYKPVGVIKAFNNMTTPLSRVTAVAAGGNHSLALSADGVVWAWGSNFWGQLGNVTPLAGFGSYARPVLFPPPLGGFPVTAIAAGGGHSLALASGTVWAWGNNYAGQLGDTTTGNSSIPVLTAGLNGTGVLNNVTAIAAGGSHSLALLTNGTVAAWGYNYYGQLGNDSLINASAPVLVSGLVNVVAISAGLDHSLALKSDGTVWAWGYNASGQLGIGTLVDSRVPVQATIPAGTPITGILALGHHSLAFSGTKVWAWGDNAYGQIGNNSTVNVLAPVLLTAFP